VVVPVTDILLDINWEFIVAEVIVIVELIAKQWKYISPEIIIGFVWKLNIILSKATLFTTYALSAIYEIYNILYNKLIFQ
jgi:hypothetical protein